MRTYVQTVKEKRSECRDVKFFKKMLHESNSSRITGTRFKQKKKIGRGTICNAVKKECKAKIFLNCPFQFEVADKKV